MVGGRAKSRSEGGTHPMSRTKCRGRACYRQRSGPRRQRRSALEERPCEELQESAKFPLIQETSSYLQKSWARKSWLSCRELGKKSTVVPAFVSRKNPQKNIDTDGRRCLEKALTSDDKRRKSEGRDEQDLGAAKPNICRIKFHSRHPRDRGITQKQSFTGSLISTESL